VIGVLALRESAVIAIAVLPPGALTAEARSMIVSTLLPACSGTPWSATDCAYGWEPAPKKSAGMGDPEKS